MLTKMRIENCLVCFVSIEIKWDDNKCGNTFCFANYFQQKHYETTLMQSLLKVVHLVTAWITADFLNEELVC